MGKKPIAKNNWANMWNSVSTHKTLAISQLILKHKNNYYMTSINLSLYYYVNITLQAFINLY